MLLILLIGTALAVFRAQATPISTVSETVPPVDVAYKAFAGVDPSSLGVRTPSQIIISCFFTVLLSVGWAIRRNRPSPRSSIWERFRVDMKVTFYGLIAPEAILWWAIRQRIGAKLLVEQMNRQKSELKWSLMHGLFAQMGGFANSRDGKVLFPHTLSRLLRENELYIEELQMPQRIMDNRKFNILSGSLVAVQVIWFASESLARLHHRVSLTALEVVTLYLTAMNIATFVVWWSKPHTVMYPVYLHIRSLDPINPRSPPHAHPAQSTSAPSTSSTPMIFPFQRRPTEPMHQRRTHATAQQRDSDRISAKKLVAKGEQLWSIGGRLCGSQGRAAVQRDSHKSSRWALVLKWFVKDPFFAVTVPIWELLGDSQVDETATSVTTFYGVKMPPNYYLALELSCFAVMMLFGAIHFLSWHLTFTTHTRLLLWRISLIILMGQPALLLITSLVDQVYMRTRSSVGTRWPTSTEFLLSFFFVLCCFGTLAYIVARSCILILAFLALSDLPSSALDDFSWASYIPHL
ncbi:hypothetical protein BDN72DRAFT_965994 [Pluteus cervinus]|uniref:Uncharacterized protein n=1 Tax=Pluteus cervinus TaxID=181527 RepID=A0ACD3A2I4_9AGAR|nr:hypothetical protein BDN72DRAFT_965994 [Pluteus cervinus]